MKINRKILIILPILGLIIGIGIVPSGAFTPGVYKKILQEDQYRINVWWGYDGLNLDSSQESFMFHGIGFPIEDILNHEFGQYLPVDFEAYIDGQPLKLRRFNDIFPNSWYWTISGEPCYGCRGPAYETVYFEFYQIFEPGYFAPGEYLIEYYYWMSNHEFLLISTSGILNVY